MTPRSLRVRSNFDRLQHILGALRGISRTSALAVRRPLAGIGLDAEPAKAPSA